jgi:hypothetical protein
VTQPVDNQSFQIANVVQPIPDPGQYGTLRESDIALFYALDFFTFVITTYPGPRLMSVVQAIGPATITQPVMQRYPILPQPDFQTNQVKFPLLAIGRTTYKHEWKRIGWESDRGQFKLLYVLPPLNAGQAEKIVPLLHATMQAIRKKTTQSFDPQYTPPGGVAGQSPWTLALSGIEEIGFTNSEHGFMEGAGNNFFPCITMTGFVIERDMYLPAQNKFAGGDVTATLEAPDGTIVSPFMGVSTQQPPMLTSLSVYGGPHAGGTSTTITGTLFLSNPVVMFGTTQAPPWSVVWNSATSITCQSPAVSGSGVVPITVINRDGQTSSNSIAFTYS